MREDGIGIVSSYCCGLVDIDGDEIEVEALSGRFTVLDYPGGAIRHYLWELPRRGIAEYEVYDYEDGEDLQLFCGEISAEDYPKLLESKFRNINPALLGRE